MRCNLERAQPSAVRRTCGSASVDISSAMVTMVSLGTPQLTGRSQSPRPVSKRAMRTWASNMESVTRLLDATYPHQGCRL